MLGGGAAPEGNHLFIGLPHPLGADTTRFKRDANLQCWHACSTCHDGLLAVVPSASQGAVLSGVELPETHHHTRVAVVFVECSSSTLPGCWQLCRKCNCAPLRGPGHWVEHRAVCVQHSGLQPLPNQPQQCAVINPFRQHPYHPVMIDGIKRAHTLIPLSTTHR